MQVRGAFMKRGCPFINANVKICSETSWLFPECLKCYITHVSVKLSSLVPCESFFKYKSETQSEQ